VPGLTQVEGTLFQLPEIPLSDETETPETPKAGTSTGIAYAESSSAPFIFFDGVSCHALRSADVRPRRLQ
jgi:hypothetical protein